MQLTETIAARDATLLDLREQVSSSALGIEHLKLLIAKLKRMQFGRKSGKLDWQIEQLEWMLEDLQADQVQAAAAPQASGKKIRTARERKSLSEHLPRDKQIDSPTEDACPSCGAELRHLGEDVSEQLELVPGRFRVIRHIRPMLTRTCTCCDCIVQVPAPSRPIERGMAGPGLLCHVLVSKFAEHLPLYRQSVIYARGCRTLIVACQPIG